MASLRAKALVTGAIRVTCVLALAGLVSGCALGPMAVILEAPLTGDESVAQRPPPGQGGVVTSDIVGGPDSVVQTRFVSPTPDKAVPGAGGDPVAKSETNAPAPAVAKGDSEKKPDESWYSVHEQGTVVTQNHPVFHSPYVGTLSLVPREGAATTETATLFAVARLWRDGPEIVFNPEIAGGKGFSGTSGIAGFTNGEATRVGVPEPTPYIARLLVRQTWGLGGSWEKLEDAANQVAGPRDVDRVTISVGKMSASDVADNNRYSHDPRSQFLNWSVMYNGAWDYPANVRGYTYGVAVDFNTVYYAVHYGIFAEPAFANGAPIDPRFLDANGQILEFEEHWGLEGNPGKLRQWVFLNRAHMGNYNEALTAMPVNPDVTSTRSYRYKYGFGLNLEQELTRDLGLFAKAGWNDGHTETWAFTEIDRSAAVGLVLKGGAWRRPKDEVGLAVVANGLSGPHRAYLAAGGVGFIVGDGRLNYAPEEIIEAYYNWQVVKGIFVTVDVQGVNNPAYNADRGPVAVGTLRVHFEH